MTRTTKPTGTEERITVRAMARNGERDLIPPEVLERLCDDADERDELAERVEELEKELASEKRLHGVATAFHGVAVKERNYERVRFDRLQAQLARAMAVVEAARKVEEFLPEDDYTISSKVRHVAVSMELRKALAALDAEGGE